MLFKLQQASAYATDMKLTHISSENRSNGSGSAIEVWGGGYLNVSQNEGEGTGTLSIEDFAGTSGLYIYGGAVEVQNLSIDKMYLKNNSNTAVQGVYALGNLYISDKGEIKNITGKGTTEGLQGTLISDINELTIKDITSTEEIARGMRLYEQRGNSSFADFGTLTINGIEGRTKAEGLVITAGTGQDGVAPISIKNLNIDNIRATGENGFENGLSVKTSALTITQGANIASGSLSSSYDGDFASAPVDVSVNSTAIRVMEGGEVIMTGDNGNNKGQYNIDGTIVVGNGSVKDDPDVAAGKLSIGGSQTTIRGDIYAGNGGQINLNLIGENSIIEGQIDDYHELNTVKAGDIFKNSAFYDDAGNSLDVTSAGKVTLNLNGGQWIARGQSFVDSVSLSNGAVVDLSKNENSSVTVNNLSGNGVFKMHLNSADHSQSDMLYVTGNFSGNHELIIEGDDFNANDITADNPLRFATVKGQVSGTEFKARSVGGGLFNNEHEILTQTFEEGAAENEDYNGTAEDIDYKPGNEYIETAFADEDTNLLLGAAVKQEQSKAGQTVIAMSKANYANAVYMDTLNKRQGEARYSMGQDNGIWVRLRHDNIGKDDAFRSHNTMVELGYDVKDANSYGEFHTGVALDYLNGSIDYHSVNGDGDLQRYGLWFYTTFLGNEGQYADLVLKYGHLKNDFDVTSELNEQISGDYSNNVVSLSAETGWKFTHNTGFYIEPQVQLQYSYVTSADYTTSQNTQVELDSIHSLIGRAGFRAGKDFAAENPITAYIRGDVLHEFLGDQDIRAHDNTGVFDATYENDDTWYSAGVGLSVMTSQNTYFYIESEQVFGADNDNTYTVSGGFKHSF